MTTLLPVLLFGLLMVAEETVERAFQWRRIATNWSLGAANWLIAALVPLAALLTAIISGSGWIGDWSLFLAIPVLILARSLGNFWLHRAAHQWWPLWALHKLHHSDNQIDITSGLRNHPIEAVLAAALAAGMTLLLGARPEHVIVADAVLFSAVIWHHAAIRLPARLSERLEWLIVTPRFHLLHHSADPADHDSNFGDLFTLWDRLFGTLRQPDGRTITPGLEPAIPAGDSPLRSAQQTGR